MKFFKYKNSLCLFSSPWNSTENFSLTLYVSGRNFFNLKTKSSHSVFLSKNSCRSVSKKGSEATPPCLRRGTKPLFEKKGQKPHPLFPYFVAPTGGANAKKGNEVTPPCLRRGTKGKRGRGQGERPWGKGAITNRFLFISKNFSQNKLDFLITELTKKNKEKNYKLLKLKKKIQFLNYTSILKFYSLLKGKNNTKYQYKPVSELSNIFHFSYTNSYITESTRMQNSSLKLAHSRGFIQKIIKNQDLLLTPSTTLLQTATVSLKKGRSLWKDSLLWAYKKSTEGQGDSVYEEDFVKVDASLPLRWGQTKKKTLANIPLKKKLKKSLIVAIPYLIFSRSSKSAFSSISNNPPLYGGGEAQAVNAKKERAVPFPFRYGDANHYVEGESLVGSEEPHFAKAFESDGKAEIDNLIKFYRIKKKELKIRYAYHDNEKKNISRIQESTPIYSQSDNSYFSKFGTKRLETRKGPGFLFYWLIPFVSLIFHTSNVNKIQNINFEKQFYKVMTTSHTFLLSNLNPAFSPTPTPFSSPTETGWGCFATLSFLEMKDGGSFPYNVSPTSCLAQDSKKAILPFNENPVPLLPVGIGKGSLREGLRSWGQKPPSVEAQGVHTKKAQWLPLREVGKIEMQQAQLYKERPLYIQPFYNNKISDYKLNNNENNLVLSMSSDTFLTYAQEKKFLTNLSLLEEKEQQKGVNYYKNKISDYKNFITTDPKTSYLNSLFLLENFIKRNSFSNSQNGNSLLYPFSSSLSVPPLLSSTFSGPVGGTNQGLYFLPFPYGFPFRSATEQRGKIGGPYGGVSLTEKKQTKYNLALFNVLLSKERNLDNQQISFLVFFKNLHLEQNKTNNLEIYNSSTSLKKLKNNDPFSGLQQHLGSVKSFEELKEKEEDHWSVTGELTEKIKKLEKGFPPSPSGIQAFLEKNKISDYKVYPKIKNDLFSVIKLNHPILEKNKEKKELHVHKREEIIKSKINISKKNMDNKIALRKSNLKKIEKNQYSKFYIYSKTIKKNIYNQNKSVKKRSKVYVSRFLYNKKYKQIKIAFSSFSSSSSLPPVTLQKNVILSESSSLSFSKDLPFLATKEGDGRRQSGFEMPFKKSLPPTLPTFNSFKKQDTITEFFSQYIHFLVNNVSALSTSFNKGAGNSVRRKFANSKPIGAINFSSAEIRFQAKDSLKPTPLHNSLQNKPLFLEKVIRSYFSNGINYKSSPWLRTNGGTPSLKTTPRIRSALEVGQLPENKYRKSKSTIIKIFKANIKRGNKGKIKSVLNRSANFLKPHLTNKPPSILTHQPFLEAGPTEKVDKTPVSVGELKRKGVGERKEITRKIGTLENLRVFLKTKKLFKSPNNSLSFSVEKTWKDQHFQELRDILTLKKIKQKKHRLKKLNRQTLSRKKRKRFYPRPVWLRYRTYLNFLMRKNNLLNNFSKIDSGFVFPQKEKNPSNPFFASRGFFAKSKKEHSKQLSKEKWKNHLVFETFHYKISPLLKQNLFNKNKNSLIKKTNLKIFFKKTEKDFSLIREKQNEKKNILKIKADHLVRKPFIVNKEYQRILDKRVQKLIVNYAFSSSISSSRQPFSFSSSGSLRKDSYTPVILKQQSTFPVNEKSTKGFMEGKEVLYSTLKAKAPKTKRSNSHLKDLFSTEYSQLSSRDPQTKRFKDLKTKSPSQKIWIWLYNNGYRNLCWGGSFGLNSYELPNNIKFIPLSWGLKRSNTVFFATLANKAKIIYNKNNRNINIWSLQKLKNQGKNNKTRNLQRKFINLIDSFLFGKLPQLINIPENIEKKESKITSNFTNILALKQNFKIKKDNKNFKTLRNKLFQKWKNKNKKVLHLGLLGTKTRQTKARKKTLSLFEGRDALFFLNTLKIEKNWKRSENEWFNNVNKGMNYFTTSSPKYFSTSPSYIVNLFNDTENKKTTLLNYFFSDIKFLPSFSYQVEQTNMSLIFSTFPLSANTKKFDTQSKNNQYLLVFYSFLFHFCTLISLISIYQIRSYLKFHFLIIFKSLKVSNKLIFSIFNSFNNLIQTLTINRQIIETKKQENEYTQFLLHNSKKKSVPLGSINAQLHPIPFFAFTQPLFPCAEGATPPFPLGKKGWGLGKGGVTSLPEGEGSSPALRAFRSWVSSETGQPHLLAPKEAKGMKKNLGANVINLLLRSPLQKNSYSFFEKSISLTKAKGSYPAPSLSTLSFKQERGANLKKGSISKDKIRPLQPPSKESFKGQVGAKVTPHSKRPTSKKKTFSLKTNFNNYEVQKIFNSRLLLFDEFKRNFPFSSINNKIVYFKTNLLFNIFFFNIKKSFLRNIKKFYKKITKNLNEMSFNLKYYKNSKFHLILKKQLLIPNKIFSFLKEVIQSQLNNLIAFSKNPSIAVQDFFANIFLLEWSLDLRFLIPENFETKASKLLSVDSPTIKRNLKLIVFSLSLNNYILSKFQTTEIGTLTSMLKLPTRRLSGGEESALLITTVSLSIVQRILSSGFYSFLYVLSQPDTDLIIREKKGNLYLNNWSEILTKAADKYKIIIPSLALLKEEQNKLLQKILDENPGDPSAPHKPMLLGSKPYRVPSERVPLASFTMEPHFIVNRMRLKTKGATPPLPQPLAPKELPHLSLKGKGDGVFTVPVGEGVALLPKKAKEVEVDVKREPKGKDIVVQGRRPLASKSLQLLSKKAFFFPKRNVNDQKKEQSFNFSNFPGTQNPFINSFSETWPINQYVTSQSKDTDLFIDLYPPKNLLHISSIKYSRQIHQPLGSLICSIYSKTFLKQQSKNILIIGAGIENGRNLLRESNFEKNLLISCLSGETELKVITDNAQRYAGAVGNVAVGIRLLREVFDALIFHTPCLFVLQNIDLIGEKREGVFSDSSYSPEEGNLTDSFSGPGQKKQVEIQNKINTEISNHSIKHYKKPYKGEFSSAIPTNNFVFDFFRIYSNLQNDGEHKKAFGIFSKNKIKTVKAPIQRKNLQVNSLPITRGINAKRSGWDLKKTIFPFPKVRRSNSGWENKEGKNEQTKKNIKEITVASSSSSSLPKVLSRLQFFADPLLTPPATSPLHVFALKEEKKFQPKKIVQELPLEGLSTEQNNLIPSHTYSIRTKVALLAENSLENISIKVDMITDLLMILDGVRLYRGFVVFATTDSPSVLDPALRRPGRLDETLRIPTIQNIGGRWQIIKNNTLALPAVSCSIANIPLLPSYEVKRRTMLTYFGFIKFFPYFLAMEKGFHTKHLLATSSTTAQHHHPFLTYKEGVYLTEPLPRPIGVNTQGVFSYFVAPTGNEVTPERGRGIGNGVTFLQHDLVKFNKNNNSQFLNNIKKISALNYFSVGKNLIQNKVYFLKTTEALLEQKETIKSISLSTEGFKGELFFATIYGKSTYIKMLLNKFFAGKISESFVFCKVKKTSNKSSIRFRNMKEKPVGVKNFGERGFQLLHGLDETLRTTVSLILALKTKRYMFSKNLIVPSLLTFEHSEEKLPNPPDSLILMPAKRYENYKRAKSFLEKKSEISINEKINLHQQKNFTTNLYNLTRKSKRFNNIFITVKKSSKSFDKISSTLFNYRSKLLNRHRQYLLNQWSFMQFPEHNSESIFLSDVDWRYTFISSIGEFIIDYPDAEQFYRNNTNLSRILLWNEISQFSSRQYEEHFIFESFIKGFCWLDKNREFLDYSVYKNETKAVLKKTSLPSTATMEPREVNIFKRFKIVC